MPSTPRDRLQAAHLVVSQNPDLLYRPAHATDDPREGNDAPS
jgi:hypothetical protein